MVLSRPVQRLIAEKSFEEDSYQLISGIAALSLAWKPGKGECTNERRRENLSLDLML
jgi:hypothetical protein